MDAEGQRILDLFTDASRHARLGDYGEAAQCINRCIIGFQQTMERREMLPHLKAVGSKMTYSLETLLMMIERDDWVAAADIIEYEFIPLWKEAVSTGPLRP